MIAMLCKVSNSSLELIKKIIFPEPVGAGVPTAHVISAVLNCVRNRRGDLWSPVSLL